MLSYFVSSLEWSSGQSIEPAPNALMYCLFLLLLSLLLILSIVSNTTNRIDRLISIMLVRHLTLKVILINELMLLLYLASSLLQ